ncbi:MAG: thioredoxin family protein [Syntrophomonas sp.]
MKDKGRLLLKGIIFLAIAGILIWKFAVPKAVGPAEITGLPNRIVMQQEAKPTDQNNVQANGKPSETVQVQEKTDAQKSSREQSGSSATNADAAQSGQSQQPAKSEQEELPIWILFRSTTCIPCIEMQKTMDALQPEFKGKINFVPVDVNDPANKDLLVQFQIRYIPTTYLYDRNKKLNFQHGGALSVDEMRGKLQALLEVK